MVTYQDALNDSKVSVLKSYASPDWFKDCLVQQQFIFDRQLDLLPSSQYILLGRIPSCFRSMDMCFVVLNILRLRLAGFSSRLRLLVEIKLNSRLFNLNYVIKNI